MQLALRPATDDDYEWLYQLNKTTIRPYAEQTYGPWDDALARRLFAERSRPDTTQVVVVEGQDAGSIEIVPGDSNVYLANIRIAPEYQRRGIGTRLISDVLRDAHGRGLTVSLRVLKTNPAQRLYARLGFEIVGETPTHSLMECQPFV